MDPNEPININDTPEEISRKMAAAYAENARLRNELPDLHAEAREAIDTYKQQHKSLYAGKFPKFPQAEHEERINHYRSERNKALRETEERARELYQETRQAADRAGETSVADVLQGSARKEANELLPLVDAEVSGLGSAPLLRRLQHVADNGSRAEQFAYLIAGRKRARNSDVSDNLRYALAELEREATGEAREKARTAYDGRLESLSAVLDLCYLGKNEVNSAMGILGKRKAATEFAAAQRSNQHTATGSGGRVARG